VSTIEALRSVVGDGAVIPGDEQRYLVDETETRALRGRADAIVLPRTTKEVAAVVACCYEHGVPITPRGGGTGYAGGCVPTNGGVVLGLERLDRVLAFDPLQWRMHVEAGVTTATVRRLARESGLLFPPDPGAAENSQIGGNIATNAGGPHAFKYGTTGAWVSGLEAVVPPGEIVRFGGAMRKDVAGYDFKSLLVGSEGTLGVVTSAWLKLIPAPEAALPVVATYGDSAAGCAAIDTLIGSGIHAAAIEYLDGDACSCAPAAFFGAAPAGFAVLVDLDGSLAEAQRLRAEAVEALTEGALVVHAPVTPGEVADVWRWREAMTAAVTTQLGGKVSEDICVPIDRLAEAIDGTVEIGARHGLRACSWGHAGDGNLHSTFLLSREDAPALEAAEHAVEELFELAVRLRGTISGEHGVGLVKQGHLARMWSPRSLALRDGVKREFDPKGLLNPGKKL
jgi:glycolate dehydrogenase FAD-linked subunit